jgi:hypothetical protein
VAHVCSPSRGRGGSSAARYRRAKRANARAADQRRVALDNSIADLFSDRRTSQVAPDNSRASACYG